MVMQNETSSASEQEQRTTLGDLRGTGKHHKVGSQRIGGAKAKPLQGDHDFFFLQEGGVGVGE